MSDPIEAAAKATTEAFQTRVKPWMDACFGPKISADKIERNHRFLEEALELVQASGCTEDEALQLVRYVYGRPQGEINQEVGGVMVTLAAHCLAHDVDMHAAGETELARIWTTVEQIRAKQAAKPKHSPLPVAPDVSGSAGIEPRSERLARDLGEAGMVEIVGTDGAVHYRRPANHPDIEEARRTPGYTIRPYAEGVIAGSVPVAGTMTMPAMVVTLRIQANAFSALVPFELTWLMRETADLLEAQSLALRKAREALEKIAAFDDRPGNAHLERSGSFAMFGEPAAAKRARDALSLLPKEGD